jgi:hypothetical protein
MSTSGHESVASKMLSSTSHDRDLSVAGCYLVLVLVSCEWSTPKRLCLEPLGFRFVSEKIVKCENDKYAK